MSVSFPWQVSAFLLLSVLFLGVFLFLNWRKSKQKEELMKKMTEHDSALSPSQQFYQVFRKIQREYKVFTNIDEVLTEEQKQKLISEIDLSLKVYLSRQFKVPALDWKLSWILKDIRKQNKDYAIHMAKLLVMNHREISEARKKMENVQGRDLVQICLSIRKFIDKSENILSHKKNEGVRL